MSKKIVTINHREYEKDNKKYGWGQKYGFEDLDLFLIHQKTDDDFDIYKVARYFDNFGDCYTSIVKTYLSVEKAEKFINGKFCPSCGREYE